MSSMVLHGPMIERDASADPRTSQTAVAGDLADALRARLGAVATVLVDGARIGVSMSLARNDGALSTYSVELVPLLSAATAQKLFFEVRIVGFVARHKDGALWKSPVSDEVELAQLLQQIQTALEAT